MKKISISIVLLLMVNFISAQKDIQYGVKLGFNVSTLNGDLQDSGYKPGIIIGGVVDFIFNDKFSLQPEILYSSQGGTYAVKTIEEPAQVTTDYSLNLGYLAIPVMGQYHFSNFFVEFGPQISFLMFAERHNEKVSTYDDVIAVVTSKDDLKDQIKPVDFGLNFGLGCDFTKRTTLNFRYNLGLDSVINDNSTMSKDAKNSVFSLALAVRI